MGDEEDQKQLAAMTEKAMEQELFNRSEKREVLKARYDIGRKLRLAKKRERTRELVSAGLGLLRKMEREVANPLRMLSAYLTTTATKSPP